VKPFEGGLARDQGDGQRIAFLRLEGHHARRIQGGRFRGEVRYLGHREASEDGRGTIQWLEPGQPSRQLLQVGQGRNAGILLEGMPRAPLGRRIDHEEGVKPCPCLSV